MEPSRAKRVQVVEGEVVDSPSFHGARAYSGTPLPADEQAYLAQKMRETLNAVRSAIAAAKQKIASTPTGTLGTILSLTIFKSLGMPTTAVTSDVQQNVLNGILALEHSVDVLLERAMPEVYAGDLTPSRWFAAAQTHIDGINAILRGLAEDSTARNLQMTWDGIFNDTNQFLGRFKTGLEKTFDSMPLIAAAAALLAVYLVINRFLPSAPQRAVSGYRRPRRMRRLKS